MSLVLIGQVEKRHRITAISCDLNGLVLNLIVGPLLGLDS